MQGSIYSTSNALVGPEAEGQLTDPVADTLLATSGAAAIAGRYEARIVIGASAAAEFKVQRRNAADDGNVGDVIILRVPGGATSEFILRYPLLASERISVRMNANLTGKAEAAIQIEKLSNA